MSKKVLVVDDDLDILSLMEDALEDEGYIVMTAENADEALEKISLEPDVILLDVMMPYKDGFQLCMEIRNKVSCPIIFITAKTEENDIVKGLALGGDDYITKPFGIRELKARVLAHLRRENRGKQEEDKNCIKFENIKIDLQGREIYYYEEKLHLTKREFDIVELLALNAGQVFSKERIYEKVWGYDAEGDSSTVSEHVKKARAKFLSVNKEFNCINTVWGVGYKWDSQKG